jgi:hypothetical protein
LKHFYVDVRRNDGQKYPKKSMITNRFGLQKKKLRYRDIDIINDKQFQKSNDTFKAVLVSLKGEGKAATKDKEIISDEDLKENIIIYTSRPMSFSKTALMFLQSMLTKISKIFSLINKFSMGDIFYVYLMHFFFRRSTLSRSIKL